LAGGGKASKKKIRPVINIEEFFMIVLRREAQVMMPDFYSQDRPAISVAGRRRETRPPSR
jgi:hypothetical protein